MPPRRDREAPSGGRRGGRSSGWPTSALYFIPWFSRAPAARDLGGARLTAIGVTLFLVVYFDAYFGGRPSAVIPHVDRHGRDRLRPVVHSAACGRCLDVFAASLLAGALPRRRGADGVWRCSARR